MDRRHVSDVSVHVLLHNVAHLCNFEIRVTEYLCVPITTPGITTPIAKCWGMVRTIIKAQREVGALSAGGRPGWACHDETPDSGEDGEEAKDGRVPRGQHVR